MALFSRQKRQPRTYWAELGFLVLGLLGLQPNLFLSLLQSAPAKVASYAEQNGYPVSPQSLEAFRNWSASQLAGVAPQLQSNPSAVPGGWQQPNYPAPTTGGWHQPNQLTGGWHQPNQPQPATTGGSTTGGWHQSGYAQPAAGYGQSTYGQAVSQYGQATNGQAYYGQQPLQNPMSPAALPASGWGNPASGAWPAAQDRFQNNGNSYQTNASTTGPYSARWSGQEAYQAYPQLSTTAPVGYGNQNQYNPQVGATHQQGFGATHQQGFALNANSNAMGVSNTNRMNNVTGSNGTWARATPLTNSGPLGNSNGSNGFDSQLNSGNWQRYQPAGSPLYR